MKLPVACRVRSCCAKADTLNIFTLHRDLTRSDTAYSVRSDISTDGQHSQLKPWFDFPQILGSPLNGATGATFPTLSTAIPAMNRRRLRG